MPKTQTASQPTLTYTALDLARELGTSDRNLSQNWLPKLEETFWWRTADLKDGERFTAWAKEEFFNLQAAISPKVPLRSADGIILRDDSQKPLMIPNDNRIGIKEYQQRIWQQYNRFPEKRVDAPLATVPAEVVESEVVEAHELSLEKIDSLGTFLDIQAEYLEQVGTVLGDALSVPIVKRMNERISENITGAVQNVGKNIDPRSRSRRAS
ncbi:hypothetical protein NDI37_21990 [Funiculus sociatus GB2-A5]|uniref:Uncharacterized protein n=1 Tax=Funiculus sociatus GB2-A5 TaxID=2933946 RepID=A0ABV0JWS6_9CYAN|nr:MULTISPECIES: hypothetical protein [unclassified Trichocoleus]MBD2006483.1 hypothetical protein [Trichocoleus sp. FACHB-40]MBD2060768.1 hypothetical protein [Trichocoleus sp. FACHB-6]